MTETESKPATAAQTYVLDDQIGYLLRKAYQRNSVIFSEMVPELTTMQFSVMRRLATDGAMSQNLLGRSVAMDGATTKGVVDRLIADCWPQRQIKPTGAAALSPLQIKGLT